MGSMRRGSKPLTATADEREHAAGSTHRAAHLVGLLLMALLVGFSIAGTSVASAESLCTDTWVGPAEGSWSTTANWSTGKTPVSTDVACIGAGKTVKVAEGTNQAGVVQGEGTLVLSGGSLELVNALEPSTISTFKQEGGTLTGAATLNVSASFTWSKGTMAGAGSTVVESSVSGSIPGEVTLSERALVNHGTITWTSSLIVMAAGATIVNEGTFYANEGKGCGGCSQGIKLSNSGETATFKNTSTGSFIRNASENGTGVNIPFENQGSVSLQAGGMWFGSGDVSGKVDGGSWAASSGTTIYFENGSYTFAEGVSVSGSIGIRQATWSAPNLSAGSASISLTGSGSVTLSGPSATTVSGWTQSSGTLTGTGNLDVSGSFSWSGGVMAGSGSTVVESGGSGSIPGEPTLSERSLVNDGTVTWHSQKWTFAAGATIVNNGTFYANQEKPCPLGCEGGMRLAKSGETALFKNAVGGSFVRSEANETTSVYIPFENQGAVKAEDASIWLAGGDVSGHPDGGSWTASTGTKIYFAKGSYTFVEGSSLSGSFAIAGQITAPSLNASSASMTLESSEASVTLTGPSATTVSGWKQEAGTLTGAAVLNVSSTFVWSGGVMSGSGSTVLQTGVSAGSIPGEPILSERSLINHGTLTWSSENLTLQAGASISNSGTFHANEVKTCKPWMGYGCEGERGLRLAKEGEINRFTNTGTVDRNEGTETSTIWPYFYNYGTVHATTGNIEIKRPMYEQVETQYGSSNPSSLMTMRSACGDPIDCVTGNYTETQTDLSIGGRGVGLDLTRTYNAQLAAKASSAGTFGYGWSSSFSDHLAIEKASKAATLVQANGSTVQFSEGSGGSFKAPAWSADTLTGSSEAGYTVTLEDETKYAFSGSSGRLESVEDHNGNKTTLSYNEKGQLVTITDPASRTITLTYNSEGLVESAKDPMGHVVKYAYASGNLTSVTLPGETNPNWRFKYDLSRRITAMLDGRGGETTNVYDSSSRVTSQKDPLGHVTKFEYEPFETKITNEATGAVTLEKFNSQDLITSITHGYGTTSATTETVAYNEAGEPTSVTDGDEHTTTYEYDGAGNRLKTLDPEGRETKWTYNGTHDVMSMTRPNGEKTTIERDSHGNPTVISRPAPGSATQETTFEYDSHGDMASMTDPLGRKWTYEYDNKGDRTSESDPEGDKRTWSYNEDSQDTSSVSPRGNVAGGEPAKYTTTIERDAQGRPVNITGALSHATHYSYDADSNLISETDPNGHEANIEYNADNEPTKLTLPTGATRETGYDGAGQVTSQTDGNKHTTAYTRNALEQVTEITDPLTHKTSTTYDAAGNLTSFTDQSKRTTKYTYNKDNQPVKVTYSDGVTPTVEYEYDKDGDRTGMIDGSGKTTYTYDQLDRLTKVVDGHGDTVGYEYDLANEQTKITYPNGKTVERTYDKASRLATVKDWLGNTTSFGYDPNSNQTSITFPAATGETDHYAYNEADQQTEAKMSKGTETLASLAYTRDSNGQLTNSAPLG